MKKSDWLKKSIIVLILAVLVPAVCSCAKSGSDVDAPGSATAEAAENPAEYVLRTIIEYPGTGLFTNAGNPDDKEKSAWLDAVGGCFDEGFFDSFYESYDRTSFLAEADKLRLTTTITDIRLEEGNYVVTIDAVDETGHTDNYETVWKVEFESEGPGLIRSVEMLADGGYFCRNGCPL